MRKVLLSTVAALSVVGFAGVASAQNFEGFSYQANADGSPILDGNGDRIVENILEGTITFPDMGSAEECNVCVRLEKVAGVAHKAADKGYDFVQVGYVNEAYGDMTARGSSTGIADEVAGRDINVSTEALAGVQANIWEASTANSFNVNAVSTPNTAFQFQYKNYAEADMVSADDIADKAQAGRDLNISTTALAGVQANIVRVGDVAIRNK